MKENKKLKIYNIKFYESFHETYDIILLIKNYKIIKLPRSFQQKFTY